MRWISIVVLPLALTAAERAGDALLRIELPSHSLITLTGEISQ
jgi:hypothetical protein